MLIAPQAGIPLKWKDLRKSIKTGSIIEAWRQLRRLARSADSPWTRQPATGHLRGIDFYPATQLKWVMATAMRDFRKKHGVYPDICHPRYYRDKVFWFKFFGEIRVGLAGDKLAVGELVPDHLRSSVNIPEVVWQSFEADLPDNDALPAGNYYIKASHGSGLFKRIRYPLMLNERAELIGLAQSWLKSEFGLHDGEWWYHAYQPRIFIEKDVCGHDESEAWNFLILNGQLAMITLYVKTADGEDRCKWLDGDFQPLPYQSERPRASMSAPPARAREMKDMALAIGQAFSSVRVDFLVGADERPHLGELTFSPGNALTHRHPDLEIALGDQWKILR